MKSNIIKGMTVTIFLIFVIGFVLYKSEHFGSKKYALSDRSKGSAVNNQTDSNQNTDSITSNYRMSSPNALMVGNHSIEIKDSNKVKIDTFVKINPLIYSSKSSLILSSEDLNGFQLDSVITDSLE